MQDKTVNDKRQHGKRSAYIPTPEDVVGMFEAGLDELSRHFHYDAINTEGGVRLTISGVARVDDESAGTWHLQPVGGCESTGESDDGSGEGEA